MLTSSPQKINSIVSSIGELPASPGIVSEVMRLTSNINSSVEELERLIRNDQVLTAKVLKFSNSSFYGRFRQVTELKEAIVILGFYTIRSLVLASSVRFLYRGKRGGKIESVLWKHSLSTAMCCRLLAQKLGHPKKSEAFICGILHDIGKLILFHKLPNQYKEVLKEALNSKEEIYLIENELLGYNHVDVGAALLDKWNFPKDFIEAISNHHSWEEREENTAVPVSWIIKYSNLASTLLGFNVHSNKYITEQWQETLERMEFTEDKATELNQELYEMFMEERKLYE
ncbi:MAG: HDOD domain-containing protein [candidate division Zixibacteria bacterium]|nr:HDOD domain-containing protein [candidate division Zixibacteria bacterium]